MIDGIFSHQSFKNSVAEMRSIITNYRSRGAKSGEDVLFEKFDNHFVSFILVGTASTHLET